MSAQDARGPTSMNSYRQERPAWSGHTPEAPAPNPGQHSDEVLREVASLVERNAVRQRHP